MSRAGAKSNGYKSGRKEEQFRCFCCCEVAAVLKKLIIKKIVSISPSL